MAIIKPHANSTVNDAYHQIEYAQTRTNIHIVSDEGSVLHLDYHVTLGC